jgi:sugar/nucleoside kinase (ribokinase family)
LLSSWKVPAAFAGVVGDDEYGRRIRTEFEEIGTDISLLEVRPGQLTPVSFILVNQRNGTRTIVNRKAPAAPLQLPEPLARTLCPQVLLLDGHEAAASLAALDRFTEAVSILDAGSWRAGTAMLAPKVDYLVASERFATQATGLGDLRSALHQRRCLEQLTNQYATHVAVTLGDQGWMAHGDKGFVHHPAYPAQAIDTTAAGDVFHGAFAYALQNGLDFTEALRLAGMAAALSVQNRGGRTSIPPLHRVQEALRHAD